MLQARVRGLRINDEVVALDQRQAFEHATPNDPKIKFKAREAV
ncbi:hypothetical protein ABH975_006877 [Bradyrhizobium ottawaense]